MTKVKREWNHVSDFIEEDSGYLQLTYDEAKKHDPTITR